VSYPIGAIMTLQTGNPDVRFRPRPVEGVKLDQKVEPEFLLLDGQQRMTSLYLALKSGRPVPTRDTKGKDLERRYFADLIQCVDPFADREDAIVGIPGDGLVKNFRGEVIRDLSTRELQIAEQMFPLDIVLDFAETMAWQLDFLSAGPGESASRLALWTSFTGAVINSFIQYQVPTIQLIRATPKEAVCQVFEKVNTGGVSLTVFELLTATYAIDDFNLRDDWDERHQRLSEYPVLARFAATDLLQIVTLLATRERRLDHLASNPEDDRAPAISCKRRDILRLELPDYRKWADAATDAVERVVPFLHGEHIFSGRDIPYATQVVPLAAIFATLGQSAEDHGVRQLLRQWYWCGVFGEMYGGSTETRFALDLQDVVVWVEQDAPEPRTVREAQFQAERLLTLRSRNSAAYKGLFAIQMKRGARDFRTGNAIDIHAYVDDAIDIHHIFPKIWCQKAGIAMSIADGVINKTAIDARTNKRIGGLAPSKYLKRIESAAHIDSNELDSILQSHDIDPVALRQDDFPSFFNKRFERLLKQIQEAMGKPVNREADASESPFRDPVTEAADAVKALGLLISDGESKVVEFKATGRRSLHTDDKDAGVEWAVVKSIAGFMNASGGTLLVGVNNEGKVVGINGDYEFVKYENRDGWELWLTDLVSTSLGKVAASDLSVAFHELDGKDVVRVDVGPSPKPIFATTLKGEKSVQFLARINNTTQELSGQDMLDYQKKRWPQ
jgi:hypothetical protein